MESFSKPKPSGANSPLGLIHLSLRSRIIALNSKACSQWKIERSLAINQSCIEFCPLRKSTVECRTCVCRKAIQDGKIHRSIKQFPDGHVYLITGIPSRIDDGNIVGSVMTLENLSILIDHEVKLKESSYLLKQLQANLNEGIFLVDERGTFLTVNSAESRRSGFNRREFRRKNFLDFFDEAYRTTVQNAFVTALDGDAPRSFAATYTGAHGSIVHVVVQLIPLRNYHMKRILAIFHDHTYLTGFKEMIKSFRQAMEMVRQPIFFVNQEGKVVYANKSTERLKAGQRTEFLGEDIGKLLSLDEQPSVANVLPFGEDISKLPDSLMNVRRDSLTVRSSPIYQNKGKISGYIVTCSNETCNTLPNTSLLPVQKREASNKAMSFHAGRIFPHDYEMILEHVATGVFIQTADGIAFVNRKLRSMMPVEANALIGKSFIEFLAPDSSHDAERYVRRAFTSKASPDPFMMPCRIRGKNGDMVHIHLILNPLCLVDSKKRLIFGTVYDISLTHQLLDTLAASERFLAIDTLASGVFHRISCAFENMKQTIQALRGTQLIASQEQSCRLIEQDIDFITDTALQVLDLSRSEHHNKSVVSFNDLIKQAVEMTGHHIGKSGAHVKLDLSSYVQDVMVSPNQMLQLCISMIVRAVNAMPSGGTLTISSYKRQKNVILMFEDTSVGMPNEGMRKAFDCFAPHTESADSALNLSWIHNIVRNHNGHIKVRSTLGKGVRFTVTLPIVA